MGWFRDGRVVMELGKDGARMGWSGQGKGGACWGKDGMDRQGKVEAWGGSRLVRQGWGSEVGKGKYRHGGVGMGQGKKWEIGGRGAAKLSFLSLHGNASFASPSRSRRPT